MRAAARPHTRTIALAGGVFKQQRRLPLPGERRASAVSMEKAGQCAAFTGRRVLMVA